MPVLSINNQSNSSYILHNLKNKGNGLTFETSFRACELVDRFIVNIRHVQRAANIRVWLFGRLEFVIRRVYIHADTSAHDRARSRTESNKIA